MEEQFKKGFFEFIAAADAEKVHSQTIGWIFSKECGVFDDTEKSKILNELVFGEGKFQEDFRPANVSVEINDIDILIENKDWIIVIENKIKSSEHSNQLHKYEYITASNIEFAIESYENWKSIEFSQEFKTKYLAPNLDKKSRKKLLINWERGSQIKLKDFACFENRDLKYCDKKSKYLYLTLVDEKPKSENWISVSYQKLYKILHKYFTDKQNLISDNIAIVRAYLGTIENLSTAASLFLKNPKDYKFVFVEGKTSKKNLKVNDLTKNNAGNYIKKLQLETLLQKWFYTTIVDLIINNQDESDILGKVNFNIGETRGKALIDVLFKVVTIDNINYEPILQFQGNAIKLGLVGSSNIISKEKLNKDEKTERITKRKIKYAELLTKSKTFCNQFNIDINNEFENCKNLIDKISTPKTALGFMSTSLVNSNSFWQFEQSNPEEFVIEMVKIASQIIEEVND